MTFDTNLKTRVLSAKDVAAFLGKSVDWVYDHAEEVGGVKRGGSWFFPNEEDIYYRLFQSRKKKGSNKTAGNGSPGRHGLA